MLRGGQEGDEPFGWAQDEGCDVEDWKKLAQQVGRSCSYLSVRVCVALAKKMPLPSSMVTGSIVQIRW